MKTTGSRVGVIVLACVIIGVAVYMFINRQIAQRPTNKPFRVTITTWVGFAPLYLAKEKGIFQKNGLNNVEILRVDDVAARKASMKAGRIEVYGSSVDNWAIDSAQGLEGVGVLAPDESHGGDGIVAKNSIRSFIDLKGKKVAVQTGMPGQFLLFHLMKKAGLKATDINIVEMDADKAGAAFVAGKIDAAVTWEPWLSKASTAGGHILVAAHASCLLLLI